MMARRIDATTLLVPMRAEGNGLIGDALLEIGPDHEQYETWAAYLDQHPFEEKRVVRDSAYWGAPVGTPLPLAHAGGRTRDTLTLTVSNGRYKYGEMDGKIRYFSPLHNIGVEPTDNTLYSEEELLHSGISYFDHWDGNYAIRTISARTMGIEGMQSYGDDVIDQLLRKLVDTGHGEYDFDADNNIVIVEPPEWAKEQFDIVAAATFALMRGVAEAEPSKHMVYRGISIPNGHPLLDAKKGDTMTFPLSAFAPTYGTAESFGTSNLEGERTVVLELDEGALSVQNPDTSLVKNERGGWIERPVEEITQGKFVVGRVRTSLDGVLRIGIRQTHYFDIDTGEYVHV